MSKYIAFRIDVIDCHLAGKEPAEIMSKPLFPDNCVDNAWIPQTMFDSIWVMYQFATTAECEAWENSLPPFWQKFIAPDLIPHIKQWVADSKARKYQAVEVVNTSLRPMDRFVTYLDYFTGAKL